MTDYERGVEDATNIYKEVIRSYVSDNEELRKMAGKLYGGYLQGKYHYSCKGCEHAYFDNGDYVPMDDRYCVFDDSDPDDEPDDYVLGFYDYTPVKFVGCWKRKKLEAELRALGVEVG